MLDIVYHFFLGLVISFVASIPLGPVNLSVAQASLNHSQNVARRIAIGSSLVELFYCILAVGGVQLLGDDKEVTYWIRIASIPVLLGLGLFNLLKKIDTSAPPPPAKSGQGSFWLGVSLNLVNPMLLPFWIGAGTMLRANQLITSDWDHLLFFTVGVAIGTYLLLMTVARIAHTQKHLLSPMVLKRVNRGVGVLFLVLAAIEIGVLLRG